jgi:outer membrane protein TolC
MSIGLRALAGGTLAATLTVAAAPVAVAQPQPEPTPATEVPPPRPDSVAEALAPRAGGLTPDAVGRAAARGSPTVRARRAELEAAAARVDQAVIAYFPRLTVTAEYARLSESSTIAGDFAQVGVANAGPLLTGPCPADPATTCVLDAGGVPVTAFPSADPVLDAFSVTLGLLVPISDYVLRLSQNHASARHAERAAELTAQAAALQAAADAKILYFNWINARGQVVVAREATAQAKAHVEDAKKTIDVGTISRGDVMRLEARVAAAQQLEAEADALAAIAEEQLRTVLHLPAGKTLDIGIDVMKTRPPATSESLASLQQQAVARRLELRAVDETQRSLVEARASVKAGYWPRLDGFAEASYPNATARIFGQTSYEVTWRAGARATWVINETVATTAASAEAQARVTAAVAQRATLADALRVEVATAYRDLMKSTATIDAAERGAAAAEESLRVREELFRVGRSRTVELIDAQTELTRARLQRLAARIGLLVAEVRLAHAVGRDAPRIAR